MELAEVIRRRRMVRAFDGRPVPADVLDRVLRAGLRGPSAGFSQGLDLLVLEGPEQTARYWDVTFPDPERRARFRWQGLFDAPVLVLPVPDKQAYLDRYREPDKARTGLDDEARWPVPYWDVDAGMAVMLMLLAAVDEGLGALFFGIFAHEAELLARLGVPAGRRPIGTIALGWPAEAGDAPAASAGRPRRPFDDAVHRGGW